MATATVRGRRSRQVRSKRRRAQLRVAVRIGRVRLEPAVRTGRTIYLEAAAPSVHTQVLGR